jgi:uncharacterized membrane protein YdbT with pleckstrin-like domain
MSDKKAVICFRPAWRSFYWHITGIVLCLAAAAWGIYRYAGFWKEITGFFFVAAAGLAVHMTFRRFGVALLVKPEEISLERGMIGRHSIEISTPNIRTIQVNQSVMQRILNVGNLLIGSSATKDYEISVSSLPNPYAIRDMIQSYERSPENKETTAD